MWRHHLISVMFLNMQNRLVDLQILLSTNVCVTTEHDKNLLWSHKPLWCYAAFSKVRSWMSVYWGFGLGLCSCRCGKSPGPNLPSCQASLPSWLRFSCFSPASINTLVTFQVFLFSTVMLVSLLIFFALYLLSLENGGEQIGQRSSHQHEFMGCLTDPDLCISKAPRT